ncbi:MAG: hypothetical protein AAGA33_05755 [Pseudomonadota bacterium]
MSERNNWQRVNELVNAAMDQPADEREDWLKAARPARRCNRSQRHGCARHGEKLLSEAEAI